MTGTGRDTFSPMAPRGDDALTSPLARPLAGGGANNVIVAEGPPRPAGQEVGASGSSPVVKAPTDPPGPTPTEPPRLDRRAAGVLIVALSFAVIAAIAGGKIGLIVALSFAVIAAIAGVFCAQGIKAMEAAFIPLVEDRDGQRFDACQARKDARAQVAELELRLQAAGQANFKGKETAREVIGARDEEIKSLKASAKNAVPRPVAKALLRQLLTQQQDVRPLIFQMMPDGKIVQFDLTSEELAARPGLSIEILGEAAAQNERPPYMAVRLHEGAFVWRDVVLQVMRDEERWGLVTCRYGAGIPDWDSATSVELDKDVQVLGVGKVYATSDVVDANRHLLNNAPAWVLPVSGSKRREERTINPTDVAARLARMRTEWKPSGRSTLAVAHPVANGTPRPPPVPNGVS